MSRKYFQEILATVHGILGWLMLGIISFFVFQSAVAQVPTGTISGTVHDASGAVVAGATVTATNRETGLVRTVPSAQDGHYQFSSLPVGVYDVKAEMSGFQSQVQQNLNLSVGQQAVLNFALTVGTVQESVTVTAAAPLVETTSGSLGGLVNAAEVSDLPLNGRSFNQLVLLQSGITQNRPVSSTSSTSIGLSYSSNGATVRSNYVVVDGANIGGSNGLSGVSITGAMLGVDAVREFRVITNFFPAEYGMTMGSQMIIVSKGGSNQFHGTAFEFLRNNALDAGNFFAGKSVFRHNNFGGSLGGPIKKDKTFFFANYEGVRETKGVPQLLNVPTQTARTNGGLGGVAQINPVVLPYLALYPLPNGVLANDPTGRSGIGTYAYNFSQPTGEDFGQVRADHTFSENDQFFARYTIDDARQTTTNSFPNFPSPRSSRGQFLTLAENHTYSASVLNSVRLSWSRPFQSYNSPTFPDLSFVPGTGTPMGTIAISGGMSTIGPSGTHPLNYKQNQFTFSDDLSWVKGKHSFKFGTLINRYRNFTESSTNWRGAMQFTSLSNFLLANPSQMTIMFAGAVANRTLVWNTFGFYVQDDWRILPRLTLNAGLRYEFNTEVDEVTGRGSSVRDIIHDSAATLGPALYKNNSLGNFGPRLGFAWDVMGDGKMALRGGFGIFYDVANISPEVDIETTGTPPFSGTVIMTPATGLKFPANTQPGPTSDKLSLRTILYHQSQPHLLSYNMTLERQLPGSMAFSATYAGSRGISLPGSIEGNPTIPVLLADGTTKFWNPSIATASFPRVNPAFASCECKTNGMDSWYNSLQMSLKKRFSHNIEFQASYTFAKHLDTGQGMHSGEAGGSINTGTDPGRLKTDKGASDFNIPQYFVFNALYNLPSPNTSGIAGALVKGWKVGAIFTAQNGLPFTAYLSGQRSNSGVLGGGSSYPDRPNLVSGCKLIQGGPDQYFNPNCFTVQAAGFLGNVGRNTMIGPNEVNLDFSLRKDTPIKHLGEAGKLEFRAEFFNILNHANFGIPINGRTVFTATPTSATLTPLATAGQISRTVTDAREIQFALKVIF